VAQNLFTGGLIGNRQPIVIGAGINGAIDKVVVFGNTPTLSQA